MQRKLKVKLKDRWYSVEVDDPTGNPVRVVVDGELVEVDMEQLSITNLSQLPTKPSPAEPPKDNVLTQLAAAPVKVFYSPMPGVIVSVEVKVGDQVVTGDPVCVLEAMKMHQVLKADWTGVVRTVYVQSGQQILDGDPIMDLE